MFASDLLIAQLPYLSLCNHWLVRKSDSYTAKRPYGKAFFAKLFAARHIVLLEGKKRSGPACNAGGFLGTSLPRQRSAFDNNIKKIIKKDFSA